VTPVATQIPTRGTRPAARRPLRAERMVALRSTLPVQLVTLRHTVPPGLLPGDPESELGSTTHSTTSKVDPAERAAETTTGKGGDAR
jgi:hypothetical protein